MGGFDTLDFNQKYALWDRWQQGVFPFNPFEPPANASDLYNQYAGTNTGDIKFTGPGGVEYESAGEGINPGSPGAIQGPGDKYYAPTSYLNNVAAQSNGGFWNGPGPFLLALAATGGVIGGAGAGVGSAETVGGGTTAPSYFGGSGGLSFNPDILDPGMLTGPATTGAEGGLFTTPALDAGSLTGPMTTAGLAAPALGAPFQEGFNLFDPSTYGGSSMAGVPPGLSQIAQAVARALGGGGGGAGTGGAGGGVGQGAGAGGNLGSLAGIGTGLYDLLFGNKPAVDPAKLNYLWQAGVDTYNTARDPQHALYDRTAGTLQEQTRAAQSARGTAMSPFGAGGEADVMKNFNIDWNNAQLARQVQGLGGLSLASGGFFNQANQNQQNRNQQVQSGTNALLTGLNTGMAPGGWLNTLWNPQNQTPPPNNVVDPGPNYWGSATPTPAAFTNPGFNYLDQNTFYGGMAA